MEKLINLNLISAYMKDRHLTVKDFCRQCAISSSTYYNIMQGKNVNLKVLFRIAKRTGIELHRFFRFS